MLPRYLPYIAWRPQYPPKHPSRPQYLPLQAWNDARGTRHVLGPALFWLTGVGPLLPWEVLSIYYYYNIYICIYIYIFRGAIANRTNYFW